MSKPNPLKCKKWDYRDISNALKILREFLLGRQFLHHARFMPDLAPRSIPAPNIPRGPHDYSNFYYHKRSAGKCVKPPIVAPIAAGPCLPNGAAPLKPDKLAFSRPPAPGIPFGWDVHCYYECVTEYPPRPGPPKGSKCD